MKNLFLILAIFSAYASAEESYRLQSEFTSGAATYVNPYGGDYFYLPAVDDGRISIRPILVSKPPREYEYFSAEEEAALSNLYDEMLEKKIKARLLAERKAYLAKVRRYNWPKVVIQDDQICVPELSASDDANWREHLTCYQEKQKTADAESLITAQDMPAVGGK